MEVKSISSVVFNCPICNTAISVTNQKLCEKGKKDPNFLPRCPICETFLDSDFHRAQNGVSSYNNAIEEFKKIPNAEIKLES